MVISVTVNLNHTALAYLSIAWFQLTRRYRHHPTASLSVTGARHWQTEPEFGAHLTWHRSQCNWRVESVPSSMHAGGRFKRLLWQYQYQLSCITRNIAFFRSWLQVLHTGPTATHVVAVFAWLVGCLVTRVICGQTVRDMVLDSTEVI